MSNDDTEGLLESGVLTLSGAHDVTGSLLITLPTHKLAELEEWRAEDLCTAFLVMAGLTKYVNTPKVSTAAKPQEAQVLAPSVACLADLRHASTQTVRVLLQSLEDVEHQQRGTVSAVYFLKPRSKARSHMLKKLLGVKPSKKRPRVPLFKVILMKTVQDLYTQVDISLLTVDFCGTLQYSHAAWMHMYKIVIRRLEDCSALLSKLPSVRDKVDLLQEYDTDSHSSRQLQQLLSDLADKFQIIVSESGLPSCLLESKQTLFLLDHPASDSLLISVHVNLVSGLRSKLRDLYSELDRWNKDLEALWRKTESKLTLLLQVQRHKERAKEIERRICDHYHPLLREHPIVGRTLSQAELYRAHYTTTLYEPAKELLSQATEILEAVQKLKAVSNSDPDLSDVTPDPLDISEIGQCLTTSIQPFTAQLQELQQIYVDIHVFHLLFEKVVGMREKLNIKERGEENMKT